MMAKFLTVAIYLLLGGWIIVLPLIIRTAPFRRLQKFPFVAVLLAGSALWVAWIDARHNAGLVLAWALVAGIGALAARKQWVRVALGIFGGMALASSMPWWRHEGKKFIDASWPETFHYAALSLLPLVFLVRNFVHSPDVRLSVAYRYGVVLAFLPFALFLSFNTGIAENAATQIAWWHHWSAYIGPAELMASGAHIFHDFAAQYGLGPTTLIATACGNNCWIGMYYIVGVSTLLLSLMILLIALSFDIRSRLALIVLPIVALVACFFWTSYGPAFSSPILYPSVAGLRFTPVVMLVASLCYFESKGRWKDRGQFLGHIIWAIGALWSPESLYAVSFVWWPYYCWRQLGELEWRKIPLAFARALGILVLVLVATLAAFIAIYFLAYHDLPIGKAWLIYMLYPPGPLPINFKGPIWWYGAALLLGSATLVRIYQTEGNSLAFRRNFLVLLLGYAALSYCMGRAHDNNFLNLTPYAMLILVSTLTSRLALTLRAMAAAMLASIIGWGAIFGWSIWQDSYQAGRLFEFAPAKIMQSFSYSDPRTEERLKGVFTNTPIKAGNPEDAVRAIAAHKGSGITLLDPYYLIADVGPHQTWDAFRPTSIYPYMPQEWRTRFMLSTAKRLHRDGWVIADKEYFTTLWLESYKAAYDLDGEEDYGSYQAYHFVPKSNE